MVVQALSWRAWKVITPKDEALVVWTLKKLICDCPDYSLAGRCRHVRELIRSRGGRIGACESKGRRPGNS